MASTQVKFDRKELEAGVKEGAKPNNFNEMEMLKGPHENCKPCILADYTEALRDISTGNEQNTVQIDNLEARTADSIIEGIDAIKIGRTELNCAKKTIISLKEKPKEGGVTRDHG